MRIIMFLFLFSCTVHYEILLTMEKEKEPKDISAELLRTPPVIKRLSRSKYFLDKDAQVDSSSFVNIGLRQKASTIKRSQIYLRFLNFELKAEPIEFDDKLTHLEILREFYTKYLEYTTAYSQNGECLDPETTEKLKKAIYDRGSTTYFEHAVRLKIKAEKKYEQGLKESEHEKKLQKIQSALRAAKGSRDDFLEAHKLNNDSTYSLEFLEEVEPLIQKINKTIRDSYPYRLGIDKAKKAFLFVRSGNEQVLSARITQESMSIEEPDDNEKVKTRPHRSRTAELLKRFIKKPKWTQEKRRSLPELDKSALQVELLQVKELNEKGEDDFLQAIKGYLDAFDDFNTPVLLKEAKRLMKKVQMLEKKRLAMMPNGSNGFIVKPEVGILQERLNKALKLLADSNENSGGSNSD